MSISISNSILSFLLVLFSLSCRAPAPKGEDLQALRLEELPLPSLEGQAGIHPSPAVLQDQANPFVGLAVSASNRWAITGWAMQAAAPASRLSAMFYVWSTELAIGRAGESQFQVAVALRELAGHESLDEQTRGLYRSAAIQAYQSMLDNFKDSLGYTAEGYSYRLVPQAFYAIRDLGGTPLGKWVETVDPNGKKIVIEN